MRKKIFAALVIGLHLVVPVAKAHTTLHQLFVIMSHENPEVLRARYEALAEFESYNSERGALLPSLSGTYGIGYDRASIGGSAYTTANAHQRTFSANQLLFDGRQTQNRVRSALAGYKRSQHLSDDTLNLLALDLASNYVNVIRYQDQVHLAKKNVQVHIDTLDKIKQLFDQGGGRKSDVSLANARLASAQTTLYRQRGNLNNAHFAIEQLVGKKIKRFERPKLLTKHLPKNPAEALKIAYQQNPLILASKQKVQANKLTVKEKRSTIFVPNINLQINGNANHNTTGFRGVNNDIQGLIVADYTFFRGGSDAADYRRAVKVYQASLAELKQNFWALRQLVQTEWNDYIISGLQVGSLKKQVNASFNTYLSFGEEFKLGKRSLLNVLDTQNELYGAKSVLTDTKYQLAQNYFALLSSTGTIVHYLRQGPGIK